MIPKHLSSLDQEPSLHRCKDLVSTRPSKGASCFTLTMLALDPPKLMHTTGKWNLEVPYSELEV
jgi:hypothetical protein